MTRSDALRLFAGVPALWVGGTYLASFAGWRQLAQVYPAAYRPAGEVYARTGGVLRWAVYHRLLRVILASGGVYMATQWPLFVGHPPLLIPWSAVSVQKRKRVFRRVQQVVVTGPEAGREVGVILLAPHVMERISTFLETRGLSPEGKSS